MAVGDLIESLGFTRREDPDEEIPEVPDDARELLDEEEPDDVLPADPKPGRRKSRVRLPAGTVKATAAEKRQVKDALALVVKVPAGIVAMRDPICGGALKDQADDIIKAAVPIICRNPTMLAWFTAANAPWLDIVGLMMAFGPVVSTVYSHHVSHTLGGEESGPDVDLSAYAAPRF